MNQIALTLDTTMAKQNTTVYHLAKARYDRAVDFFRSVDPDLGPFASFSAKDWLALKLYQLHKFEGFVRAMHSQTHKIFLEDVSLKLQESWGMNLDFRGLVTHTEMWKAIVHKLYGEISFRRLFPKGTTKSYLYYLATAHELSRWAGINGRLPLDQVDDFSERMLEAFCPHSPAKHHLHEIGYLTGRKKPPDLEKRPLPLLFKLIDTCSKPDRRISDLFLPDGEYARYLRAQELKRNFPIVLGVGEDDAKYREISLAEYAATDTWLTALGYSVYRRVCPNLDLDEVIRAATQTVMENLDYLCEKFGNSDHTLSLRGVYRDLGY